MATGFLTMCKQLIVKDVCNNVLVFLSDFVLDNILFIYKKKWKMGKELAVMDLHR